MKADSELFHKWRKVNKSTTLSPAIKTAVVYTRVSSKEQAEKNLSLDFQKKAIDEYAQRNAITIAGYFGGTYESAKTDGRKEFKRMLDFIKKNKKKISHILVYTHDRFSRTGGGAIKLAQDLREKYGVEVFAVTQPTDTSNPSGVFQQNIQLLFSEFDNQLRRQRVIAGIKEKLEKGIWCIQAPPGYDIIKVNGERKMMVNETGKKLRRAFEWKAKGMKNEEILERLRSMGWDIYPQKLSRALSNPFYCGIISNRLLNGKLVEGTHEKLISPELFLKVNDIRSAAKGKYGVSHKKEIDTIPLKLFMKCPKCGEGYTGYVVKKKKIYYYKCRTVGCRCNKNAKKVNNGFADYLSTYSVSQEYIRPLLDMVRISYNYTTRSQRELEETMRSKLAELQKDIDTLEEKYYVKGTISQETFEKFYPKYVEEREKVLKEMPQKPESISNLEMRVSRALIFSSKLSLVWASSEFAHKERLQKLIFPKGISYNAENDTFRTEEVNEVFRQTSQLVSISADGTKEKGEETSPLAHKAEREGFEPPDL